MSEEPIVVNSSGAPAQTMTAIRDALKVFGSALAAKGVIDGSYIEPAIGLIMVVGPVLWSQYVTFANHRKVKVLAAVAPDNIGVVK